MLAYSAPFTFATVLTIALHAHMRTWQSPRLPAWQPNVRDLIIVLTLTQPVPQAGGHDMVQISTHNIPLSGMYIVSYFFVLLSNFTRTAGTSCFSFEVCVVILFNNFGEVNRG